ncbi:hypothetical protein JAAARDRAFT_39240 [Jaapia argillacea MUCL 33604]|uniref:Flavin reductase like domain-containing protein n=1 Tax=Jaapia argillacea MUCL 33604 TaxID=933084 RepID=A0A067PI92_9AGAM|nr:hypothetical protein JAAARDRAFT_39240 [Jaapia argillacea MUCL 33604]
MPTRFLRKAQRYFSSTPFPRSGSTERPPFNPEPSFKFTRSPNPNWKLGQGLSLEGVGAKEWKEDEEKGWKTWVTDDTPPQDCYRLLTSAIGPRPIAFVSTLSATGVPNLAPFSYFNMVAHNPPLISIAFTLSTRRPKDTRENIKATKEFTVNIISEPFIEAANSCSVESPEDIDEWIVSGLTQIPSTVVKPARVRESAVSLECELYHFHDICPPNSAEVTNSLVLGHIKLAHIRNAVLAEDGSTVDPQKLRPVARFGGMTYARLGEGFELSRPSWREIRDDVRYLTEKKT